MIEPIKPREFHTLLESELVDERRAGSILVETHGLQRATNHWRKAVVYLFESAGGSISLSEAESLAMRQILDAVEPRPAIAVGNLRPSGSELSPRRPSKVGALRRIAVCGNHAFGGDLQVAAEGVIDEVARVLAGYECELVHGPRGAGILVANLAHNRHQSSGLTSDLIFVDRVRIVGDVDMVMVIGGVTMTRVEVDIAFEHGIPVAPLPGSGGVADVIAAKIRHRQGVECKAKIRELARLIAVEDIGSWLEDVMTHGLD